MRADTPDDSSPTQPRPIKPQPAVLGSRAVTSFDFAKTALPASAESIRTEIRALLERERLAGTWSRGGNSWGGFCPALSRALGAGGFIGMTWPRRYGGGERSYLERYVVTEELLASGAPTGAHWVADRQSGPLILRFGTEEQKERYLPPITRGESYFCIGMSEPDSGSDLASIRTRAERASGGYRLIGTKIWTSSAHRAHTIIVLCRTDPPSAERHAGMSQLLVPLDPPGIKVRPIINLLGNHDFNEVVFDGAYVPAEQRLGEEGAGWQQVTSELSYERAGPERFLTNFHLLVELVRAAEAGASALTKRELGGLLARLYVLRQMSQSVAGRLERGELPNVESALVKDLGTHFQQEVPETVRRILLDQPGLGGNGDGRLAAVLERAVLAAPAYTIQGGTTEILRGIVARALGLR